MFPAAVTAWALVIAGLAYYSYRTDDATVRDQRTLEQAMPVAESAFAAVLARAAAGPGNGGPRPVISFGAPRIEPGCRVTSARDGAELTRRATVYLAPEDSTALVDWMAGDDALPHGFRIWLGKDSFRVDAGEFIGLRGVVEEPGVLRIALTTGCRPVEGELPAIEEQRPDPASAGLAEGVLASLGAQGARQSASVLACPGGGTLTTTIVAGPAARAPVLAETLTGRADRVLVDEDDRFAFHLTGAEGVAVEVTDGEVEVAATTSCG